jgi:hypothetical protein
MAFIKYHEGYMDLTALRLGVIPKPYQLWPKNYQHLVLPAQICFSVAWSLEIVSHLEELTFWLFLLHQVSAPSAIPITAYSATSPPSSPSSVAPLFLPLSRFRPLMPDPLKRNRAV